MANRPGEFAQKISSESPIHKNNGIDWVVGANSSGVGMQVSDVTLGGATTAVLFSALGLKDMDDAAYKIFIGGEYLLTEGTPNLIPVADLSTRTTTGFDIIGGVAADVAQILVIGKFAGQIS